MTVDTPSVGRASYGDASSDDASKAAAKDGSPNGVRKDKPRRETEIATEHVGPAGQAAVAAAEMVLAHRFGSAVQLVEPTVLEGSGPATVVRARVATSSFSLPRTVVIKHYPQEPAPGQIDPFAQEAVSYQLFTALPAGERMCPELLAHEGKHRVLVIEDLGRAPTLRDKLHGQDAAAAERALLAWARSLAKLHTTTAAREADFDALLRRLNGSARKVDVVSDLLITQLPLLLNENLGVQTAEDVRDRLARAVAEHRSTLFRAFSPVDLSPDNNLVTSGGVRFLDFERGLVRSAFADAVHLRMPFLSYADAFALPKGMSEAMLAVWRAEVLAIWPRLADDSVFFEQLLHSQLVQLWLVTHDFMIHAEQERGGLAVSRPSALIAWWTDLAEHARGADLGYLAEHAEKISAAVRARYPAEVEFPLFPAFR
jgi:hypothetical protein